LLFGSVFDICLVVCGRYSLSKKFGKVVANQQFGWPEGFVPRYNLAPTQFGLVVAGEQKPDVKPMRWGLIPSWAKDISIGQKLINARAETLQSKPSFRAALKYRRCLVLCDGFYEWRKLPQRRQPVRIRLKSDEVFAFAGLWEHWQSPEGTELETYTIITTTANELIQPLHERMPVILSEDKWEEWLDRKNESLSTDKFFRSHPAEEMEFYDVSPALNSVSFDSPECIERWRELRNAEFGF
jgi:putative SOS response-associated peptidase YedK